MSFESRLRKETPRWVAAGVVTADQAARIEVLHPEQEGAAARRFLAIITGLGAALCIVGIALIISANWDEIHRWIKIVALVLLMAAAYGGGYWLKWERGDFPRLGDALLMTGSVMFLLGIALVSQIFHLDGRPGNAVLVWIAGIAAVPFLTRARGAFFILLLAVYSWLWIEATARDGWLTLAASPHRSAESSLPFVLLCGSLALYWAAFLWRETWRGFAAMQQAWPVLVVCATVYAAGFMHKSWWGRPDALLAGPALVLIAIAALTGAIAARRNWNEWRMLSPWLLLAAVPALVASSGFLGGDARIAGSWLSWITLVVLNVFMARAGLQRGEPWLVNAGIAFIALNLFTRYFDIFSSMLDQGLMFLVSGAVVLGVGWYLERKRRALLGAIKRGGAS
jgi:uncharacterized membrane protein